MLAAQERILSGLVSSYGNASGANVDAQLLLPVGMPASARSGQDHYRAARGVVGDHRDRSAFAATSTGDSSPSVHMPCASRNAY